MTNTKGTSLDGKERATTRNKKIINDKPHQQRHTYGKGGKSSTHKYATKTRNREESTNAGYWRGICNLEISNLKQSCVCVCVCVYVFLYQNFMLTANQKSTIDTNKKKTQTQH